MKRSKTNSRRIKRLERKTASGSTIVNAFLGSSSGSGGVSSFLELSDTPTSYTGESGKVVAVKATEDGLEFITAGGGGLTGSGTTNEIAYFTGATSLASLTTATYPSLTELSYVKGVTSAIQTQFTGKLNTGLAWLLASGGTLTGNNEIIGTGYTLTGTWTALGTTQTDGYGLWFRNTTAAAAGAQQISPSLVLEGQGWKTNATAASQSVKFAVDMLPVQGTSAPLGLMRIRASIAGGAYTTVAEFRSDARLIINNIFTTAATSKLTIAGGGPAQDSLDITTNDIWNSANTTRYLLSTQPQIRWTTGTNTATSINNNPTLNTSGGTTTVYGFRYNPTTTATTGITNHAYNHTSGFVSWDSVLTPAQITSNQNDYNPTGWQNGGAPHGASILRLSTDASRDLTGLTGGVSGRLVIISNVGSQDLVIKDESASSTAANRFALNADITINADEGLMFWYDSTSSRWRALSI